MIPVCRTALLLLFCAAVVPALALEQGAQTGPPLNQQFPGPNGLANFRKIVSGEFTGNLSRDAVVMDADSPRLLVAPEYFDTSIGTGNPANDIAVLSGAVPGKDLLVTAESDGLKLYERMSATSSWSITVVRDASTAWANAALVAVGDVNGDGLPDIVGVPANKRDLLFLYGSGGTNFTTGPTLVNPAQTIHQLLLMNWTNTNDTANSVEPVFFSNLGWAIREDSGVWRKSVSWSSSLVRGVVLSGQGGATDRLVTTAVFNGTDRLSICDVNGTEGPYNLGALGIVALASGDMSGPTPDGDADLVLSTNTDRDLRVYENLSPSATTFDFATPAKFRFGPVTRNPAYNQAGLTLGDFDCNGRMDVLAPAQGDPNPAPTGTWGSIALVRMDTSHQSKLPNISNCQLVTTTTPHSIKLTFDHPTTLIPANQPGDQRKIYVGIYRTPDLGLPTLEERVAWDRIDVPGPILHQTWSFNLPPEFTLEGSEDLFSVVAYQVVVNNGVVVGRGPANTALVVPGSNMLIVDASSDTHTTAIIHREHDGIPVDGSFDQGPIVPPPARDKEPKE